jgi:hypothetical protein
MQPLLRKERFTHTNNRHRDNSLRRSPFFYKETMETCWSAKLRAGGRGLCSHAQCLSTMRDVPYPLLSMLDACRTQLVRSRPRLPLCARLYCHLQRSEMPFCGFVLLRVATYMCEHPGRTYLPPLRRQDGRWASLGAMGFEAVGLAGLIPRSTDSTVQRRATGRELL